VNHNESLRIMLIGLIRVKDIGADHLRCAAPATKKAAFGLVVRIRFSGRRAAVRGSLARRRSSLSRSPFRDRVRAAAIDDAPVSAEKKKAAGTAALRQRDPKTGGSVEQIGGLGGNLSDLSQCGSNRLVPRK
jgi:hypothetical protein